MFTRVAVAGADHYRSRRMNNSKAAARQILNIRALGRPRVPLPHSMEMQARARLYSSFPYKIVACGAGALTSRGKQVDLSSTSDPEY
jgi:hypothetical protein